MRDELLKAGRWAIEQARNRGVEAEAFLLHSEDLTIEVRDGQVDTLKQAEEIGIGVGYSGIIAWALVSPPPSTRRQYGRL